MSEIPSEFFSRKTFQSLPRLAFLTWLIVFIIDAVIVQRFPYTFMRVLYIWIIGMIISFLFELGRYKNMNAVDKADYKKYFMLLNAFIIFLYASSYTGLTKQIGAWGELQSTVNNNTVKRGDNAPKNASIFLATVEWAIPVLARQTSYFPDVTAIAENNELKMQNAQLEISLIRKQAVHPSPEIDSLKNKNSDLNNQIHSLVGDLKNCGDSLTNYITLAGQRSGSDDRLKQRITELTAEIRSLQSDKTTLQNQDNTLRSNITLFLNRVIESNRQVSRLVELRGTACIAKGETGAFRMLTEMCPNNVKDVSEYRSILFNLKPIDIK